MRRWAFLLAIPALVAGSVLASAGVASAGTHAPPVITATQVTFTIPASPAGVWQMTLNTKNTTPSQRLGRTTGTSGTLTLPVPQTATCDFQVDVKVQVNGTGPFRFYSGVVAVVPGSGQSGTGQRFTPGYWKNHAAATTALLPQTLGGYTVSTFADAQAVFNAMKCNQPADCLAGHLLAAQLDVANGSATCVAATIADANTFLISIGYNGVASYTLTSAQQTLALSYEATLDSYTNDSTSGTC